MKPLALLIAIAGIASATAITFNSNDTGILYLTTASTIAEPAGTNHGAPGKPDGPGGAVGGLCVGFGTTPAGAPTCPGSGVSATDTLTFTLPTAGTLRIRLQDEFQVVDVYQLLLTPQGGSATVYQSSTVNQGGSTPQACFDAAVTNATSSNSCLDITTGVLAAGNYSINIWNILLSYVLPATTSTDPFDNSTLQPNFTSGIDPAHVAIDLTFTAVPEPATFGMLGLGGIALGMFRRFRK